MPRVKKSRKAAKTQKPAQEKAIEPNKTAKAETKKEAKIAGTRPAGVTIICALGFVLSILLIIAGVFSIAFASYAGEFFGPEMANASPAIFMAIGAVSVIIGLIGIFAFYLLMKMKKAGWLIVTIVGIIAIISGIISITGGNYTSIVSIILWIIIIGYLWTKRTLFA